MSFSETVELAPGYVTPRVIRGGWQLAGGHGAVDASRVAEDLLLYFDAGLTTYDCADIYTGVEEMLGAFRERLRTLRGDEALKTLKIHTKFVPDLDQLPTMNPAYVRSIIERSLRRLRVERLDLVQFHWWDYEAPGAEETALTLRDLQREGKIDLLGATNFDRRRLRALCAAGAPIRAMQVQYSLLDDRPAQTLAKEAEALGVSLLAYGTVAGGFLSERWLDQPPPAGPLTNRSLVKYRLIVEEFGGWELFQSLLRTLSRVAARHDVDIAAVASRWVLDQPAVAGVIIGAKGPDHLAKTLKIGALRLSDQDKADLAAARAPRQGPSGEVYALERDRSGPHGAIMKYNLNQ